MGEGERGREGERERGRVRGGKEQTDVKMGKVSCNIESYTLHTGIHVFRSAYFTHGSNRNVWRSSRNTITCTTSCNLFRRKGAGGGWKIGEGGGG